MESQQLPDGMVCAKCPKATIVTIERAKGGHVVCWCGVMNERMYDSDEAVKKIVVVACSKVTD